MPNVLRRNSRSGGLSLTLCVALTMGIGLSFKPQGVLADGVSGSCVYNCDGGGGGGGSDALSGAGSVISGGIANMIRGLLAPNPAAEAQRRQAEERRRILEEQKREEARRKAEEELQKLKGEIKPEGTMAIDTNNVKRNGVSQDLQPMRKASAVGVLGVPIPIGASGIIRRGVDSGELQPKRESSAIWRGPHRAKTRPKITPVSVVYKSPAPGSEPQPQVEPQVNGTEQTMEQGANPTGTTPNAPLEIKRSADRRASQTTAEAPAPTMPYPVGANDMIGKGAPQTAGGVSTFGTPIPNRPDLNTPSEDSKSKLGDTSNLARQAHQMTQDNPTGPRQALTEAELMAQQLGANIEPNVPPVAGHKIVYRSPTLRSGPQPQAANPQGSEAQASATSSAAADAAPQTPEAQDNSAAEAQRLLMESNNNLAGQQEQLATTPQP